MSEQHNHHCIITAGGRDWRIKWAEPGRLYLESLHLSQWSRFIDLHDYVVLDISAVDWPSYCATAAEWDKRYV